ncbi:MAG TPA: sigma-70 family RNA polymerase sigma factor [Candidatus Nitrosotenuis sp.]|nr:sigma-70 family RNA polymerase sigma factor [Candidatus Nitrosotenuis sp.]
MTSGSGEPFPSTAEGAAAGTRGAAAAVPGSGGSREGGSLQAGELTRERFEQIFEEYAPYVYNLAYRYAGNRADAEDLTQEAMVRVYRFLDSFRGGSFKSWLYRIVSNLYFTRFRKDQRGPRQSLERVLSDGDILEQALPDSTDDPALLVEQRGLEDRVQLALDRLHPQFRTALVLRDVEGLSYEEIASVLECPIGTVRSRIARGREQFRIELGKLEKSGRT